VWLTIRQPTATRPLNHFLVRIIRFESVCGFLPTPSSIFSNRHTKVESNYWGGTTVAIPSLPIDHAHIPTYHTCLNIRHKPIQICHFNNMVLKTNSYVQFGYYKFWKQFDLFGSIFLQNQIMPIPRCTCITNNTQYQFSMHFW
jgi:hypothetical protein